MYSSSAKLSAIKLMLARIYPNIQLSSPKALKHFNGKAADELQATCNQTISRF
jgi:hypothetical protein